MFRDRTDAGRKLADELRQYADRDDVIVLALPRGGVPVASEVAAALRAPLDLLLVRKLGLPGREELAMGAVASGGVRILNEEVVRNFRVPDEVIDAATAAEEKELTRRERLYRGDHRPLEVRGRTVVLIDDGLATGSTMRAALGALRKRAPAEVVVAVPVGAPETCAEFESVADRTVCLHAPEPFFSVGMWYDDFSQTTDEEVRELLERARSTTPPAAATATQPPRPQ